MIHDAEYLQHAMDSVLFASGRLGFTPDPKQELVLRARTRRGLLNCSRQWGKSTVTAVKAVHRAYFHSGSLVIVVSPSERQSGEFLRKAAGFVRLLGIAPRGDGDNAVSLLLPNRSRIVGLPGIEATVRGFSAVNLMLIDEAARVKDEMYKAVRPMLAVGGGELWLMSTPCGQRGFFWDEWNRCTPAAGRLSHWLRISVPATECPRIPKDFLDEERATLGERWFRQEYLCEFTESEGALFDEDVIRRAIRDDVQPLFPQGPVRW